MGKYATNLVKDDSYEEIAATYQCLMIAQLNEALLANGIEDSTQRRAICESFTFHQGVADDQFWFEADGKRWFPILGFTQQEPHPVLNPNRLGRVQLRSDAFEYHEYAHGNVAWYFDEHDEDASEINTGN